MKSGSDLLFAKADQLERLARLMRERPQVVEAAARAALDEAATTRGLSLDDWRVLDYVVTTATHAK